jgi:hypothetical protein
MERAIRNGIELGRRIGPLLGINQREDFFVK